MTNTDHILTAAMRDARKLADESAFRTQPTLIVQFLVMHHPELTQQQCEEAANYGIVARKAGLQ